MENTFIDSKEKIGEMDSALDFITVRNSDMGLVFMGQRKNIKCFDRLKKVSERVFETIPGQTYKFLDKMPEPAAEIEITQAAKDSLENAFRLYKIQDAKPVTFLPIVKQPELPKLLSFEQEIIHNWKTQENIRREFISLGAYEAFMKARKEGKAKIYGQGTSTR